MAIVSGEAPGKEALTAIDVDAGATTASGGAKATAQFALNRAVLPTLAAEIRLRNLSGAILVDLAGLPVDPAALRMPTWVAAPGRDRIVPPRRQLKLARAIPGAASSA